MIKRVLLLRWVFSSIVDGKSLLEEVVISGSETVDLDTNETGAVLIFLPQMDALCGESVMKKALKDDL